MHARTFSYHPHRVHVHHRASLQYLPCSQSLQMQQRGSDGEAGVTYKGKTSSSKILCFLLVCVIVALVLFVILAIALAVALGVVANRERGVEPLGEEPLGGGNDTNHSTINVNECLTVGCSDLLTNIVTGLDQTVDPCDDFYQFSCGNWISNTEIPTGMCPTLHPSIHP